MKYEGESSDSPFQFDIISLVSTRYFRMMNKSNQFDLPSKILYTPSKRVVFVSFALLFLCIIIYSNSLNGTWIFDDEPNIVLNKYIQLKTLEWDSIKQTFYGPHQNRISRPFAYFTFGVNYYFGQLNPFGYHVVNLLIQYCAGMFLFLFIYRTLNLPNLKEEYGSSSYAVALLATFFWAVNPVQVTAVTYIVQRMASMTGIFYIISMYFYLIGRTDEGLRIKTAFFILSAVSAALAMGTKENAIMLPVSIYLYDLLLIQGITRENLLRGLKYIVLPAFIVASVALIFFVDLYSLLRLGDYAIRPFTMLERILTETRVIVFYISLLLYPVSSRLMLSHDFVISKSLLDPWTTLVAVLIILGCLGLSIAGARKKPLISYCILFFFLNHLIESSIIPLELLYEHRNYIPSMLFFVPIAVFAIYVLDYFSFRTYIQLMAAMLISFLLFTQGHTVYMYNNLFKDPYLLWTDNVNKAPNLSRPHNNVAVELSRWGLYDEAYTSYEKAYQLNRNDHLLMITYPINNMGRFYFRKKDYETAISYFNQALDIDPRDLTAQLMFIKTQIRMNELENAEGMIQQILAKRHTNTDFRALLSFILLKKGLYQEAIKEGWKTLTFDNEAADVKRVLGEAYRRKGLYERAVSLWEQYVTQHRNDLEGHLALIELYSKTGQLEKLNRTIARVMILKGSKNWRDLVSEYQKDHTANAYEPDHRMLLSIILTNLKNQK